jgi:hypothetical protein
MTFDAREIAAEADARGEDALATVIGQLVGYGSVCWENPAGAGVFDSTRAKGAVDSTLEWLRARGGEAGIPPALRAATPRHGGITSAVVLDEQGQPRP